MTISRSEPPAIPIATAVIVDDRGRTLRVRKRGTQAHMQPGGKVGSDESSAEAPARELREELGCDVRGAPRPLGRFSAPAANEMGSTVEAELFAVELLGNIAPAAEIEDARWHHPDDVPAFVLAPLTRDHVVPLVRQWSRG